MSTARFRNQNIKTLSAGGLYLGYKEIRLQLIAAQNIVNLKAILLWSSQSQSKSSTAPGHDAASLCCDWNSISVSLSLSVCGSFQICTQARQCQ